ncbi:gliding motility lipoprotein GldH [Sediminicola luteus]|uniref:Gliding motility lipoprotein GldH n=1 Tax=Sediminicola luteus TaxID=319238 RepID=A0A2A4GED2_9FLAO|nr:gliding motility lipoprotein GldH [Sediminicola luteus]PCE66358.1 gliding motility lipoprotein GldH [Sediminicola luteus]
MPSKRFSLGALALLLVLGCQQGLEESQYQSLSDALWDKDRTLEFQFTPQDTLSDHHIFINLRNDNAYPFANLFLITEMEFPTGQMVTDTLEYDMALPSGEWLGQGTGSIKENKLWYKENIVFPSSGVYTLRISHAMRDNGSIPGVKLLPGITDVGFQIEKTE